MSEHRMRNYDVKCLLELLSCVLNQKEKPKWRQSPVWGEVYKFADYHNVANDVYYGVIGDEDRRLGLWKKKFEERFHSAVLEEERYSAAVEEILGGMEEYGIHCMLLKDYLMRSYYPRGEMRALRSTEFLIEKNKRKELGSLMELLDFEKKEIRGEGGICYYKIPGVLLVFHEEFFFINKKMNKYFSKEAKDFPKVKGTHYIHEQEKEEFYLYVIAAMAEDYARGRLEIQHVMDLWQYYMKVYRKLDWAYLRKKFEWMEIYDFSEKIVQLAAYWFGEMIFSEEEKLFAEMERYIVTKGMAGRKGSEQLLPLVKEVADFYKKDLKKERRQMIIKWLFPQKDYMETMFPILKKIKIVLPFFWVVRLLRIASRAVRNASAERSRAAVQKIGFFLHKKKKRLELIILRIMTIFNYVKERILKKEAHNMAMSIDKITECYKNIFHSAKSENKTAPMEKPEKKFDEVLISSSAQQIGEKKLTESLSKEVISAVKEEPSEEKMQGLKQMIADDAYMVDCASVAARILLNRGDSEE